MTLYEELSHNLSEFGEFYRVQGGLSRNSISFNCSDFSVSKDNYLYLSKSMQHHRFFLDKRIRQFIDSVVFEGQPTIINDRLSMKQDKINHAISEVQTGHNDFSLECLTVTFFPAIIRLIQQNCLLTRNKPANTSFIERVDVKNGTGYGLVDEWLELFCRMIILVKKRKLTNKDIIEYLKVLRQNGFKYSGTLDPSSILDTVPYNYAVNSANLSNPFIKYEIANLLEAILEKGIALKSSNLYKDPKGTIKEVIDEYQKQRTIVLRRMESIHQKNLS